MTRLWLVRLLIGLAAVMAVALPSAAAQQAQPPAKTQTKTPAAPKKPKVPWPPDKRRWDIEIHRGFGLGDTSKDGRGTLPSAGEAFTTGGGSSSRYVPTWFLGDGSTLLNDVLASFGRSERIRPLDSLIMAQAVDHTIHHGFGGRVTRTLSPILALEIGAEVGTTAFTMRSSVPVALDGTSDSFVSAFSGLVAAGQGVAFTNAAISSSYTTENGTGAEIVTTGSLTFGPKRQGRLHPYVAVGGGLAIATGEATGRITGRYAFRLPSGAQVDETDAVTIHFKGGLGAVLSGGGGLDLHLSHGTGVRADFRYLLVQNHVVTAVDTRALVVSSTPADVIWSSLVPGIQFSTNPSTGKSSNLSAPALDGFHTLKGRGFHTRISLTIGYFWRF